MPPSRRSRGLALCSGALLLLSLGACGTPRVQPTASPSPVSIIPPTPSASAFVSAVTFTRALGTARMAVDVSATIDGVTTDREGNGTVALAQDMMSMHWESGSGRAREVVTDQGTYVQTDIPDGTWTRLPDDEPNENTGFVDPLRGLGGLLDVVVDGNEDLGGISTVRYSGRLPADASALAALGLAPHVSDRLGGVPTDAMVEVTAWVDGSRVLRIDRSLEVPAEDGGPLTAEASVALSDFGVLTDIQTPPSQSVISGSTDGSDGA